MTDVLDNEVEREASNKRRKKQLLLQQKQNELDLVFIMSTAQGRNAVWNLLSIRGPYTSSFSSNPIEMAFNEGNRNFSCRILDELMRVCPELYLIAQQEAINREKEVENGNK